MALKKLLNKGTVYKRSDSRWGGMVSYHDEQGVYRRKCFCAPTKKAVLKKIADYIEAFKKEVAEADEANKPLRKSMQKWLEVFQFGTVERATYDRKEDCAKRYIYPRIGDLLISDINSADLNGILTQMMNEGYAHSTVKHIYSLLNEYFRYLCYEEYISKNPMAYVRIIKKANFLAAQGKGNIAQSDAVTVLTNEEIQRLRETVFTRNRKGAMKHQQAAAYLLMLNTGLRTGEVLGLINSDIDLDNREMLVVRAVKERADCRRSENSRFKAHDPTQQHGNRDDSNIASRAIFQRRQSADSKSSRRLHKTVHVPLKAVHTARFLRNPSQGSAQPASYLRHAADQRH